LNTHKDKKHSLYPKGLESELHKTIIEEVLRKTRGNITESAKILGMTRANLHILIKQYNIKIDDFKK
jgi:transcriptional regulator with GAF, ATPase, and Fis domain